MKDGFDPTPYIQLLWSKYKLRIICLGVAAAFTMALLAVFLIIIF